MLPLIDPDTVVKQAFEIIDTMTSLEAVVVELRKMLAVDHVVYNCSGSKLDPTVKPYVKMTYPSDWIKRYVIMDYAKVDPVLKRGFLSSLTFDWSEIRNTSADERAMLEDALVHGIGPFGLSIPVVDKTGHRGLFSITYSGKLHVWEQYKKVSRKILIEIANHIHGRVIQDEFGSSRVHLTAREIECLSWSAKGKDSNDIATIIGLSVHTVRDYLKSARFKLGCVNVTQAVNKAMALGIIF